MTWKSTTVAGLATVAATWLASYAPTGRHAAPGSTVPSAARTASAAEEIQREADRLHARLSQVTAYRDPARNPFRFVRPRPTYEAARPDPAITVEDLPHESSPSPPTLRLTLAGIAEDTVDGQQVRTAIISTPGDVLLVKVGDRIGDQFTVAAVDVDAVELVRIDSGATVRLALKP
jgi:Tfp pilus assembly protein PilP